MQTSDDLTTQGHQAVSRIGPHSTHLPISLPSLSRPEAGVRGIDICQPSYPLLACMSRSDAACRHASTVFLM